MLKLKLLDVSRTSSVLYLKKPKVSRVLSGFSAASTSDRAAFAKCRSTAVQSNTRRPRTHWRHWHWLNLTTDIFQDPGDNNAVALAWRVLSSSPYILDSIPHRKKKNCGVFFSSQFNSNRLIINSTEAGQNVTQDCWFVVAFFCSCFVSLKNVQGFRQPKKIIRIRIKKRELRRNWLHLSWVKS